LLGVSEDESIADVRKVYRGTGRMEFDKYELNNIHYWPLFTSTSKSYEIAYCFALKEKIKLGLNEI
jgi:hypothetical protein